MVRTKEKKKEPKDKDFEKRRDKVGKMKKKPESYTNTDVKFRKLRQVNPDNKRNNYEKAITQCNNPSQSIKRDGLKQLIIIQQQEPELIIANGMQVLQIIFKHLNDEHKTVYEMAGDLLVAVEKSQILNQNLQFFRLNCKLEFNNNFILNRQNFIKYLTNAHVSKLNVDFLPDLILSLQDPVTSQKTFQIAEGLLNNDVYIQSTFQEDYFSLYQQCNYATFDDLISFLLSQEDSVLIFKLLYQMSKINKSVAKKVTKQLPIYSTDFYEQFQMNAYCYLITRQESFIIKNELEMEREFDLKRIVRNIKGEETPVVIQQKMNSKQYINNMLESVDDYTQLFDCIKQLLLNNVIDQKYLQLFVNKQEIMLENDFNHQSYVIELCKSVLKNDQYQLQFAEKIFEFRDEVDLNQFRQIKIKDQIVKPCKLLLKRFSDVGLVKALAE